MGTSPPLRYDNWKLVFKEHRCPGTLRMWAEPFTNLRVPKLFNLRTDPYERVDIDLKYLLRLAPRSRVYGHPDPGLRRTRCMQTFERVPVHVKSRLRFNHDQVITKLQETAKSD